MSNELAQLDDPGRIVELRELLRRKRFLREIYEGVYRRFAEGVRRCPPGGLVVELGSGAGFIKDFIPEAKSTDILPYTGVDLVVDAAHMPFPDESLSAVCMINVFHHLPDVERFLLEAQRCLLPGGRVFMLDQHPGWLGAFIFKHLHHEPFDMNAADWSFASTGPLSGANGALAWIVFRRDLARLKERVPRLELVSYAPVLPLSYWLAGGLKSWTLVPGWASALPRLLDRLLLFLSPEFGTYVEIELMKTPSKAAGESAMKDAASAPMI